MQPSRLMRNAPLLAIAWTVIASGCGGAVATSSPTSRGTATETAVATSSPTSGGTATETATASTSETGTYSVSCVIWAAKYDQSCTVDSDCALVADGDFCGDELTCAYSGTDPISATAVAQFEADVAKTPVGSGAVNGCNYYSGDTNPGPAPTACCQSGACAVANWDEPCHGVTPLTIVGAPDAAPNDASGSFDSAPATDAGAQDAAADGEDATGSSGSD